MLVNRGFITRVIVDGNKLKSWIKESNKEQTQWMYNYLLKRKLNLTKTNYVNTKLARWQPLHMTNSTVPLIDSLDLDNAEDRELLRSMRNAWDKIKRGKNPTKEKRTYQFSKASLSVLKSHSKAQNMSIENYLDSLIRNADHAINQFKNQEKYLKKSYLETNKKLREQNKQLSDQIQSLTEALEFSQNKELAGWSRLDEYKNEVEKKNTIVDAIQRVE